MVYIDLEIAKEEEINNGNFKEISVAEILKERSLEVATFDFYVATKLCEDVPCSSHSLDLVATVDFKFSAPSLSLKTNHDEDFGKL